MGKITTLTGNETAGFAMKQIEPDVVCAFPITPQTELMHKFADYVNDGAVKTELVLVESEHSAMSGVVGAAAAGVRTMTATSSQGLALMWEILYIAAGMRLPIVMPMVNRALSAPINIHCDHSDSMGCRDSGWIQLYCENNQEIYDTMIQAIRIAEDKRILLPVMVCFDGFIISHTTERLEVLSDDEVKKFIGKYEPKFSLFDFKKPITFGPLDLPDYYYEVKRQEAEAMDNAPAVILEVAKEYAKLTGRSYGFFEEYKLADAELAIVVINSAAGTAKVVVDELRAKGQKVGLLKLRSFRPFPVKEVAEALKNAKAIAVMDRAISFGAHGGPVFNEIRSALYASDKKPVIASFIYGLGGRDVGTSTIEETCRILAEELKRPTEQVHYLGVRE